MKPFTELTSNLKKLVINLERILIILPKDIITQKRNNQNRNIKQILGHMIDSASNNTHRIIHLQYQESPICFPDYANLGNNDRWIAIQNYEQEEWEQLVQLWKFTHLHICHVIENIDESKLGNIWISALKQEVSLKDMIEDFPRHFDLHVGQIQELIEE
jgi:hypothetical protein